MGMTYAEAKAIKNAVESLTQLELTGEITPREQAALDKGRALLGAAKAEIGATGATYRGLVDGGLMGFRDEIAGAVNAFGDGTYAGGRDQSRQKSGEAAISYPAEYATGQTAGAIGSTFIPYAGAAKLVKGAGLLGKTLVGTGAGAASGAVQGFGYGEGGFVPRLQSAALPAAVNAIAGGFGPIAGAAAPGVAKIYRNLGNKIPGYGARASNTMAQTVGKTVDAGTDITRYLDGLGPEAMIADVGGLPTARAQGLAGQGGGGAQILRNEIEKRAEGSASRITHAVDETIGQADDAFNARAAIALDKKTRLGPMYEAALAFPDPIDPKSMFNAVDDIMDGAGPTTRAVLSKYKRALAGKEPISAAKLHGIRSDLSDAKNAAYIAGKNKQATILSEALDTIDGTLDEIPGYADARGGWADTSAISEAIDEGRKVFTGSTATAMSPKVLREKLAGMTDAQKSAYQKGAREWVDALMGTSSNDAAAAWRELDKGWTKSKLALIIGDSDADLVIKRIKSEKVFSKTRGKVLEGSQTDFRAQSAAANVDLADIDTGRRPTPVARVKRKIDALGNEIVDSLVYGNRVSNANLEVGKMLTRQGPEAKLLADQLLKNYRLMNEPAGRLSTGLGGLLNFGLRGGAMASTAGPR
jgi:hypothetical protein